MIKTNRAQKNDENEQIKRQKTKKNNIEGIAMQLSRKERIERLKKKFAY